MKLLALLSLFPLLQVALAQEAVVRGGGGYGHHPTTSYCGTTTITKDWCTTETVKAPAVTKTFTKDKQLCFTTEVHDQVTTATNKVHVTSTYTHHPEKTITRWDPAVTTTKTKTRTKETCTPTHGGYGGYKRDLAEGEEEADEEFISNAERLRRGLPLNKPEKRTYGHGPKPPKPSCVPSTSTIWDVTTKTKTVTPTSWTVTTKCRYTKTIDIPRWSTTTVTKTKTKTRTVEGETITEKIILTPTSTETKTKTKTIVTGECYPTYR